MSDSKYIRKFERLLFNGIPEQPEPVYERDANNNVSARQTGKAQSAQLIGNVNDGAILVGTYVYDFDNMTELFFEALH